MLGMREGGKHKHAFLDECDPCAQPQDGHRGSLLYNTAGSEAEQPAQDHRPEHDQKTHWVPKLMSMLRNMSELAETTSTVFELHPDYG